MEGYPPPPPMHPCLSARYRNAAHPLSSRCACGGYGHAPIRASAHNLGRGMGWQREDGDRFGRGEQGHFGKERPLRAWAEPQCLGDRPPEVGSLGTGPPNNAGAWPWEPSHMIVPSISTSESPNEPQAHRSRAPQERFLFFSFLVCFATRP